MQPQINEELDRKGPVAQTNPTVELTEATSDAKTQESCQRPKTPVVQQKLKRSVTSIPGPTSELKHTRERPASVEPKMMNSVADTPDKSIPIIEVKKPEANFGKRASKMSLNISTAGSSLNPSRTPSYSLCGAKKPFKSCIPLYVKQRSPTVKSSETSGDSFEKKTGGTVTGKRVIRRTQPVVKKHVSTPCRSKTSNVSSLNASQITSPSIQSRSPNTSSCASPTLSNREDRRRNEQMRNVADCLTTLISTNKDNEVQLNNIKNHSNDFNKDIPVDFIMHAKDIGGEIRSTKKEFEDQCPLSNEENKKLFMSVHKTNMNIEQLLQKKDVCWLVHLNQQNQANFHQLRTVLNTLDIEEDKQAEITKKYHTVELSQMDIVENLTSYISKLQCDYEKLMTEIDELKNKQSQKLADLNEKISSMENKKATLLEEIHQLNESLEEEKMGNAKKLKTLQAYQQIKPRIQKAEIKVQDMEKKYRDLDNFIKSKEAAQELYSKKHKNMEVIINRLENENKELKVQLEEMKNGSRENAQIDELICQQLKDAENENASLQEQLREEVSQREKTANELQETSFRLQGMEEKLKNLTTVLETAKNELALKDNQGRETKEQLEAKVVELTTELQARKVMTTVAEDNVAIWKNKYEQLTSQFHEEEKKERKLSENDNYLKMEISIRDEQITQLQTQIKSLIELKFKEKRDPNAKKLKKNEDVTKIAQVSELEQTVDELAKDNLELHQMLSRKNLELEQRDNIVKMQVDVLKIRDELIALLKIREPKSEKDIKQLTEILRHREKEIEKEWQRAVEENWKSRMANVDEIEKICNRGIIDSPPSEEALYQSGTINDLYSSLEKKQMQLETMQKRVKQLEEIHNVYNNQRKRQEARIDLLERALSDTNSTVPGFIPVLAQ